MTGVAGATPYWEWEPMKHTLLALLVGAATLFADQTLKAALDLTMDQARQTDQIQAVYRRQFAAKRTERNTELRKLRRARIANDSAQVVEHEKVTEARLNDLRRIRAAEDAAIEKLLTLEQRQKSEAYKKAAEGDGGDFAGRSGVMRTTTGAEPAGSRLPLRFPGTGHDRDSRGDGRDILRIGDGNGGNNGRKVPVWQGEWRIDWSGVSRSRRWLSYSCRCDAMRFFCWGSLMILKICIPRYSET
ncbi:MAG: hypothetical protein JNK87_11470 [Bryobacterales bacterium]|nr:hypothetical protein [Bryobacterales bacterium]